MSNLVNHATRELARAGVESEISEGVIKMIQIFAGQGHSGSSAYYTISIIQRLMSFENIAPLTTDPSDWMKVSDGMVGGDEPVWQSTRCADAFSNDNGRTYYRLEEMKPRRWWRTGDRRRVMHNSEPAGLS